MPRVGRAEVCRPRRMPLPHEQHEVHERSAPTGSVVYETIKQEGEQELERPTAALAWSGLAAGLSMGFSFAAEAMLHAALPGTAWRPLVSKFGYCVGFLIVILGRQQLFTENTLTVVLPVLRRRDSLMFTSVTRLWATVLIANLIGALLFASASAHTSVFSPATRTSMLTLGRHALQPPFATVLVTGIFAGWLIALMVWLLPFAETARVNVIIIVTYVVGVGQFAHVIAGSVETLYVVVAGERSVWAYLSRFLVPALAGNIVGGVSLVAGLAHAQYTAEPR
ncbi:MAG: formate/nitrite transporter family protein [Acidobacteria bacterium]|nr:formate/nitrite transporter family protein [Acidobacteriota bacterium]